MIPALCRLLLRTWANAVQALGTTTLGLILLSIVPPVLILTIPILRRWRQTKEASDALLAALKASVDKPQQIALAIYTMTWVLAYSVSLVGTIYKEHLALLAALSTSDSAQAIKDHRIQFLEQRLANACYLPDRRLTQEQIDVLHHALKQIADKYDHPYIQSGFFAGDTESQRFWYSIYRLFKNAGWTMDDRPIMVPQRRSASDPPSPGYDVGLSIQIPMETTTPDRARQRRIVEEVGQAFVDAGLPMTQYPVGPHHALPTAKDLLFWTGVKSDQWPPER